MARTPYLSIVNRVFYIDFQGMKRIHIVGLNRPTAQQEISKIHSKCPEAIIVLQQDSNRAIQIVPGSGKASEAAKQKLIEEIDNWANDLQNKTYYSSVADWAIAAGNTVCVIQPPAKSAITAKQIDDLKNSIRAWIEGIVNAPAQQPNPGTGTGTGGQPNPGTGTGGQPNPGTGTGGGTQAPTDPLEGFTPMQREGYEKTLALIQKINCG
ncbi:MAG: hypothetical protein K5837_04845 [Candidatus Saccharibacteria bacterium]|nr:hypothetical protein [Candidatus Saccharibacteria bacterium]